MQQTNFCIRSLDPVPDAELSGFPSPAPELTWPGEAARAIPFAGCFHCFLTDSHPGSLAVTLTPLYDIRKLLKDFLQSRFGPRLVTCFDPVCRMQMQLFSSYTK